MLSAKPKLRPYSCEPSLEACNWPRGDHSVASSLKVREADHRYGANRGHDRCVRRNFHNSHQYLLGDYLHGMCVSLRR